MSVHMGSKYIYTPIVFKELTDEQARTDCFQENLGAIQWLQGKHLLASHKNCSRCSVPMNFTTKGYVCLEVPPLLYNEKHKRC